MPVVRPFTATRRGSSVTLARGLDARLALLRKSVDRAIFSISEVILGERFRRFSGRIERAELWEFFPVRELMVKSLI